MGKKSKQTKQVNEQDKVLDTKFEKEIVSKISKKQQESESEDDYDEDEWNNVPMGRPNPFSKNLNQMASKTDQSKKNKSKKQEKLKKEESSEEEENEQEKPFIFNPTSHKEIITTNQKKQTKQKKKQQKEEEESISNPDSDESFKFSQNNNNKNITSNTDLSAKSKNKKTKQSGEDETITSSSKLKKKKSQASNSNNQGKKSAFWDHICITMFLLISIILMGYMKYIEEVYSKTTKVSSGEYGNLYEVLELDSGASMKDIKRAYKKLAILWHPDKNPNCKECETKFHLILKAYEILGNNESKQQYDTTSGVTNTIKSQAIQLTSQNFENFVLESNDVWILQVYENDDGFSSQMAPFWESAVEKYSHLVKFGRINKETDYDLLKYVPFNVQVIPTIFSFIDGGDQYKIYTYNRYNPEVALHQFVGEAIQNKVNVFSADQAKNLNEKLNTYQKDSHQVDIVYIPTGDKIPIEYKYAAFKYNNVINFHASKYGQSQKVKADLGVKNDNNLFIYFNNEITGERQMLGFKMNRKFNNELFNKIMKLAKFLIIPEIDRSSFKDYCENISLRAGANNEGEDERQNLCIIINSKDEEVLKEIEKTKNDLLKSVLEKLNKGGKNIDKVFENYGQIQFITLNQETHWKFVKSLTSQEKKFPFDQAIAYAILAENRKVAYQKSIHGLEDWVLDLADNEGDYFDYLNEYLPEDLKGIEIAHLLKFKNETLFNIIYRQTKAYIFDWKILVAIVVVYLTLSYLGKNKNDQDFIWKISLIAYVLLVVVFVYGDIFEELHH